MERTFDAKYKIEYVDELPDGFGAVCTYPAYLPFFNLFGFGTCAIKILAKYKDDTGIHNHEKKHAEQYKNSMFHILKSKYSKDYRYKIELEAYEEQVRAYNYSDVKQTVWIADALFNKYDLGLSRIEVDMAVEAMFYRVVNNETTQS